MREPDASQVLEIIKKQLAIIEGMLSIPPGTTRDLKGIDDGTRDIIANMVTIIDGASASTAEAISVTYKEGSVQGDKFENIGAGATIINRSVLNQSLNSIRSNHGDDLAKALERLAQIIEENENVEAAESFAAMSEELATSTPRRGVVQSLWTGIVAALPAISDLTAIGEQIAGIIS
ncbi:hypothetical protein [Actinomadura decatromicini]|nr:hypothetical protein [Actinomadura decatromicini]